jgi:Cu2+-exporting ATPase
MTERCELCDLPVRDTRVEEDGDIFCCRGCKEVYATLGETEIDETRDEDDEPPEDCETAFLHVGGMHCTACEVFVESAATRHEGVEAASASYATETVRVDYDDDAVDEDELPDVVTGAGYEASHRYDDEARREKRNENIGRLVVGGFFGMMVMVMYAFFLYPTYFGYEPLFDVSSLAGTYLFGYIVVMTSVVLFYTGAPILRGAYVSLRARQPNMDLLVALAALSAYAYSAVALGFGRTDLYFDVSVAVVLVVSVGGYYERRTKRRALGSLADVTRVRVDEARREGGETVAVDEVEEGDRLVVRSGERVPVDGFVAEGSAAVDESVVTGEAEPKSVREGDYVVGGSVVRDDAIIVEAAGDEGALDRLTSLLWDLQSDATGVQRLADRLATVFVPLVVAVAAAVLVYRLVSGAGVGASVLSALTVLIVSCPCALGLATPLAVASGVREAVERRIVVSDDTVFERVRGVETYVLDKTGTLTTGRLEVVGVKGGDNDEVLRRAAAVERLSSHPVAEAVVRAHEGGATRMDGGVEGVSERPDADGYEEHDRGVEAIVDGDRVVVGDVSLLDERGWATEAVAEAVEEAEGRGRAVVVGWSGEARGVLTVSEREREGWRGVVGSVAESGARVVVLTGDEGESARPYEEADCVDEVFDGVPPEAKAETVRRLCDEGTTAMVGDGTNDAPALAAADLGIAMGGGAALASDAADVTILDDDLSKLETVVRISDAARRRTRRNIGWAFLYNSVAVPLAVAGFLNPLLAAGAMATSSLLVTVNSSRPLIKE